MWIGRRSGGVDREVDAVEDDAAGVRQVEPGDHPQQRGLAAAGRPQQGEEFAGLDLEADVVDGEEVAEAAGNVLDLEERHAVRRPGSWGREVPQIVKQFRRLPSRRDPAVRARRARVGAAQQHPGVRHFGTTVALPTGRSAQRRDSGDADVIESRDRRSRHDRPAAPRTHARRLRQTDAARTAARRSPRRCAPARRPRAARSRKRCRRSTGRCGTRSSGSTRRSAISR